MSNIINVPLLAMRDLVIFPRMVTHFDCGRQKSIAAVEAAEIKNSYIMLVAQKDANVLEPKREDIFEYGTLASVKQILKLPGGVVRVLVEGIKRAKISEITSQTDYFEADVEEIEYHEFDEENQEMIAAMRLVEEDLEEYQDLDSRLIPGLLQSVVDSSTPETLVDTSAAYINLDLEKSQELLETIDPYERLIKFHSILKREIELLSIERKIDKKVKYNMNKVQREYYLKEQLKVIHQELGDEAEEDTLIDYELKIDEANLPEAVKEKALKELSRLSKINSANPEYSVILTYLDWILDLPWNDSSADDVELKFVREVLEKEHFGLKDVKDRILEFMAVRSLTETSKGPILCLVGPPGVGKTSIASSIAHSLSKEFVRMSLGGITDESEIRGHRRTYIGALPGRVISLMKKAEENNPVFLLDEIDKVGRDFRGDPASALLEVLDPEQNNSFTDRYLELPFDLSKVFFIATANTTSTIPRPLLDRMEVIRLSGYTPQEKFEIAKRYLVPKQIKENGLKKSQLKITDNALKDIINYYTREAGVRGLEKEIAKCARKAALKIIEEGKKSLTVSDRNLNTYIGEKRFLFDLVQDKDRVGVVNGLAWTEVGGETLEIESTVMDGSGKLMLTGKLGDVMKESVNAAVSYIASNAKILNVDPEFRKKSDIHVHVPEGAVPKDGPSAGVAMFVSVLSSLTGEKIKANVAMTGEITLTGRVLAIGGLKEKLLAAERMGIKKVLIPAENEKDLKEIDENILKNIEIVLLKDAKDAIKHVFGGGNEHN